MDAGSRRDYLLGMLNSLMTGRELLQNAITARGFPGIGYGPGSQYGCDPRRVLDEIIRGGADRVRRDLAILKEEGRVESIGPPNKAYAGTLWWRRPNQEQGAA